LSAAEMLAHKNISVTVADARFAKPLDTKLVDQLYKNHRALITIEEGSGLGFGAIVLQHLNDSGLMDKSICRVRTMRLPDEFQDQDKPEKQYDQAGLNAAQIAQRIVTLAA